MLSHPLDKTPWLFATHRSYTAEEVLERLQIDRPEGHPRTVAVHAAAAMTGVWSTELSQRAAVALGRAASRLPTVVYWHRHGLSSEEIGRRLSPLGTSWDAERALSAAASLIAQALNRGDVAVLAA